MLVLARVLLSSGYVYAHHFDKSADCPLFSNLLTDAVKNITYYIHSISILILLLLTLLFYTDKFKSGWKIERTSRWSFSSNMSTKSLLSCLERISKERVFSKNINRHNYELIHINTSTHTLDAGNFPGAFWSFQSVMCLETKTTHIKHPFLLI